MKRAFALIYVLVIMMIIMITITSILTLGLSGIRQKNKVLFTAGAYQMAQSGIEDGIANYRKDSAIANCAVTNYYKVSATSNNYTLTQPTPEPLITDQGMYSFKICPSLAAVNAYIVAIGYFKGSRVRMEADFREDMGGSDATDQWDIYQIGF